MICIYTCSTHTHIHTHTHTHTALLGFVVGLDEEVVRFVNKDSSPIIFACEVTGFPATVFLLVNGQPQPFGNPRVTVEIGNPSCRYNYISLAEGII